MVKQREKEQKCNYGKQKEESIENGPRCGYALKDKSSKEVMKSRHQNT